MKKIYGVIISALMFMALSLHVSAAEKEMVVPLDKGYPEIVFYFEFGDGQEHDIYITKPDGEIISQVATTATTSVSIMDSAAGDYKILITADKEIVVKSRVECKSTTAAEGSSVSVASAITGLEAYFVNGDLAVSWQDTNIGDVIIKVTVPQTMQVIAEEKTSATSCLIPLDDTIKNIEVYVVPAVYARVEGAGVGYSLDVIRDVGATFDTPVKTVTNQSSIYVPVSFIQPTSVIVESNGEVKPTENYEAGEYEVEVPITGPNNEITLYFMDAKGNINYSTFSMTQDLMAPALTLNGQYDGYVTENPSIVLSGYIKDAVSLYVNDTTVAFDTYGRFECEYPLEIGSNVITLKGYDEAGNEVSVTANVARQEPQKDYSSIIIFAVTAVIIVVVFFIIKNKNKGNDGFKPTEPKERKTKDNSDGRKKTKEKAIKKEVVKKAKEKPVRNIGENLQIKQIKSTIKIERKTNIPCGERRERMRKNKFITEVVVSCVQIGVFAALLLFVVKNTVVSSGSMEPTLMTKDIVIFNRLAYTFSSVERGDIINFWSEEYDKLFSKRVIGIAGDIIEFHDGFVFINGQQCDESAYIGEDIETNCTKTFVVPEGHVFVMGDNRENSIDSRFFVNPYIPIDDIEGKYLGTIPWIFD